MFHLVISIYKILQSDINLGCVLEMHMKSIVKPRDNQIIAALEAAAVPRGEGTVLKPQSLENLKKEINAIAEFCGPDGVARAIVSKRDLLHSCIEKRWTHPPTRRRMLSAIVSALKWDTQLGNATTRQFWRSKLHTCIAEADALAKDNVLTDREAATMPTFEEMNKALASCAANGPHDTLNSSQHFLWLIIATTIAPKRADWGQLQVVRAVNKVPPRTNAVVVPHRGTATLVLADYKTEGTYHLYTENLSNMLTNEIRISLRCHPRGSLFVGRDGKMFKSRNAWRQWVQRAFEKLINRKATVNGLRKLWVQTYANSGHATIAEMEELARKMLHSVTSQQKHYIHKILS